MKYSYARIATVFVLMLSLLLTACSDTPTTAPGATAAKYSLRYVNFKVYDPVYVGIDKGFFSKYGLQVEIIGDSLGGPNRDSGSFYRTRRSGLVQHPRHN